MEEAAIHSEVEAIHSVEAIQLVAAIHLVAAVRLVEVIRVAHLEQYRVEDSHHLVVEVVVAADLVVEAVAADAEKCQLAACFIFLRPLTNLSAEFLFASTQAERGI